ncbi:MAG: hypothetical protein ACI85F_001381 [Bacteroidia bacterium]|jgi:hypothetical protein
MEVMKWVAIAVAALSTMAVGFVLYNPKVIGKSLSDAISAGNSEKKKGHNPLVYVISIVMAGVIAYKLHGGAGYHSEDERHFLHGAFHGLMSALYLVAPVLLTNFLFEGRPAKLIVLHIAYWLACFALMGGILYAFAGAAV